MGLPSVQVGNSVRRGDCICAEPVLIVPDTSGFVCLRQRDGHVVHINHREASALIRMQEMLSASRHVEILCTDDITKWAESLPKFLGASLVSAINENREGLSKRFPAKIAERRIRDIQSLYNKGLILSESHVLDRLFESSAEDHEASFETIQQLGVPTCRRPSQLMSCLSSFTEKLNKARGSQVFFHVVDDSRDAAFEADNRAVVQAICERTGAAILHHDSRSRLALIKSIARRAECPDELVEFALFPNSVLSSEGAARNTLCLTTAGYRILQTDDDTLCSYSSFSLETSSDRLRISASPDPCETWFYKDHETNAASHNPDSTFDPLATHSAYLGQCIRALVNKKNNIQWQQVPSQLIHNLLHGGGHIGVTATGCLGDCGRESPGGFFVMSSIETVLRTNDADLIGITGGSREVFRAVPVPTLSRGGYFQAMSSGLDNTRLLPPFFPSGRNEDGAFAFLYLLSDSAGWIAHLPWAIRHRPEQIRRYSFGIAEAFTRFRMTDLLVLCIASLSIPVPVVPSVSLPLIGQQLIAVSTLPKRSFIALLRLQILKTLKSLEGRIDERLAMSDCVSRRPREILTEIRASIRRSLIGEANVAPVDLESKLGAEEALNHAQEAILKYGRLLIHWERLVLESRKMVRERPWLFTQR